MRLPPLAMCSEPTAGQSGSPVLPSGAGSNEGTALRRFGDYVPVNVAHSGEPDRWTVGLFATAMLPVLDQIAAWKPASSNARVAGATSASSFRDLAVPPVERSFSENDLPPAPGWHQPQPAGPARRNRGGHRGSLLSSRAPAPVRRVALLPLPTSAGHRRALLHPPQRLCRHIVRSKKPQDL